MGDVESYCHMPAPERRAARRLCAGRRGKGGRARRSQLKIGRNVQFLPSSGLENGLELYRTLYSKKYIEYLLTYKLLQDHLESFFSAIRSRGGFNSNPSSVLFKSAYKKLLVHHQVSESAYANCTILDTTSILPISLPKHKNVINTINNNEQIDLNANVLNDHDYISAIPVLSTFVEDVTNYIAGFVVKQIKKRISCTICEKQLETNDSTNLLLLKKIEAC